LLSLSQTTGYAIMALSCLDPEREQLVQEKDISGATGIPKPYLTKLLHRLGNAGMIDTKRGNKGGIKLVKPPEEISIMDIFTSVEGEEWQNKCLLGLSNCGLKTPCPIHTFWLNERGRILEKFESITLDQIMKVKQQGWRAD